jgi:hypothetical protein
MTSDTPTRDFSSLRGRTPGRSWSEWGTPPCKSHWEPTAISSRGSTSS